jgi:ABC-2 type transport system ATP-binding protein
VTTFGEVATDDDRDASPPVVSLSGVGFAYGRRTVLRDVSFDVTAGVTALVGPNGSGKSTLLAILATLLRPSAGLITYEGSLISGRAGRRRARSMLGHVPQRADFPDTFTVAEAVTYAAWLHRVPKNDTRDAVLHAMEVVGLSASAGLPLRQASGGTLQRVFIAQAVVHRPRLLILDEATVGVDAEQRVALRELLSELAVDRAVLLSTHLTEDLELLADRVLALGAGSVTFDGSAAELVERFGVTGEAGVRPVESALRNLFARVSPEPA